MPQLKFDNPAVTEEFAASMKRLGAPLPWDWHDGALLDANGRLIAEFYASKDPNRNLEITSRVVIAMNTCGGFKAKITGDEL
ncbi:MAG: hypothetical protein BVN33_14715 [Proteobacteria bacterium ST_bin13]|nr:MAG: hypothetical protein BVN33_14715 [Proteobacteria bacterium ST_bin13]